MFRRANNVEATWEPDLGTVLTGSGRIYLTVGKSKYALPKRVKRDVVRVLREKSANEPVLYGTIKGLNYWRFDGRWFTENDNLGAEEIAALVRSSDMRAEKRIRQAKAAVAADRLPDGSLREAFGDDVRLAVWERDGGKCTRCGATEELQFDHVIPVSLGGANSVENLQVLCGRCNRLKGTAI